MRTLRWHGTVVAVTVVAMLAAYIMGRAARHSVVPPGLAWAAGDILATCDALDEGGVQKGDVKINGISVIKFEAESGGLSAYERAMLAANRINLAAGLGSNAEDFSATSVEGTDCLVVGDRLVAAADEPEATAAGKTTAEVVQDWVVAVQAVFQSPPPVPTTPRVATATKTAVGGADRGQVSVNGTPVFALQVESGGLTAYERAMLAANRINIVLEAGGGAADFNSQTIETIDCVVGADQLIATVDPAEATGGKTTAQVAQEWVAAIQGQVPGGVITAEPGGTTEPGPILEPETPAGGEYIVPILKVGTAQQIGLARLQGPPELMAQVQAVAMLTSKFKNLLVLQVLVPIPTNTATEPLARVQGVGVCAVAMTPGG